MSDTATPQPIDSSSPNSAPVTPAKKRFTLPFFHKKIQTAAPTATNDVNESQKTVTFLLESLKHQSDYFVIKFKKTNLLWLGAVCLVLLGVALMIWLNPSLF